MSVTIMFLPPAYCCITQDLRKIMEKRRRASGEGVRVLAVPVESEPLNPEGLPQATAKDTAKSCQEGFQRQLLMGETPKTALAPP